jgi:DNA polymerase-1
MSFWSEEEINETKIDMAASNLGPDCDACGLCQGCNSPMMKCGGLGYKNVMFIGEAPGPSEDSQGEQFVGSTGSKLYTDLRKQTGIDLHRDAWKMNALSCWPHRGDGLTVKPKSSQVKACKPLLDSVIDEKRPSHIVLVGAIAVESFFGDRFSQTGITRWRGLCIPDKKGWVIPIFHPSYVQRLDDENLNSVWMRDLYRLGWYLKRKPFKRPIENIQVIYDIEDIIAVLRQLQNFPTLYFDYETTGLKPFRDGHRIVSIAVSDGVNSYSFPYQYRDFFTKSEQAKIKHEWSLILKNENINKRAQNMKFEDTWSRVVIGTQPANWNWDTMIAAHVMDNRRSFSGLKFQTYLNFGIDPYDQSIKKYLMSEDGGNGFNNVDEAPLDELLYYGGMDVFYGNLLAKKQIDKVRGKSLGAYNFLHEGIEALADVQMNGICVDEDYYAETEETLQEELDNIKTMLPEFREAKLFEKRTGRPININSTKDLGHLFYDILKMPIINTTDKGNPSLDKDTFEQLIKKVNPTRHLTRKTFMEGILRMRKLDKIVGTYLAQFKREAYNGMLYPFFNLHIPISYRGSSSNPNFQNIPKRDEDAKKACRSGIIPRPGNQIMEADYSGIEVCISACYHKDPKMIEYITDPTTDMHRDSAEDIWMLPEEEITKEIRFFAKNCWVFPQFYGSYYAECAKNLITTCVDLKTESGVPLIDHYATKGISIGGRTFNVFEDHLRDVEKKFWERFSVYAQWKKDINEFYRKNGFTESYLGFKFQGYMKRNDVSNYAIQGTAFHCLMWSLIRLNRIAQKEKWKTKIIGQIHDAIVFDLYPPEKDHVIATLNQIGTIDIRNEFDWIIVPLEIEYEIALPDMSWYDTEEIKEAA